MSKKITQMSPSERQAAAGAASPDRLIFPQNSLSAAFPQFNEQGIFQPGMTKTEYATVQFIAAWVQAHGKMPSRDEMQQLTELAILSLNSWIGFVSDAMQHQDRPEHNFDNHEGELE
jgi:hypothetical protein